MKVQAEKECPNCGSNYNVYNEEIFKEGDKTFMAEACRCSECAMTFKVYSEVKYMYTEVAG